MSDGLGKDQDSVDSHWLTEWETRCIDDYGNENDSLSVVEERTDREREVAAQRLWLSFQSSASAISILYKEGGAKPNLWIPFQNAASSVTSLYKDGVDVMKKCFEMGKQYGQHRRNDELIAWTRSNERHIRREELVGYLCGKNRSPQPAPRRNTGPYTGRSSRMSVDRSSPRHNSPRLSTPRTDSAAAVGDMQPFLDALSLSGLNGAMSKVGIRNSSGNNAEPAGASMLDDNHSSVVEEITRHHIEARKRLAPTPSPDDVFDSPSKKRSRFK